MQFNITLRSGVKESPTTVSSAPTPPPRLRHYLAQRRVSLGIKGGGLTTDK